MIQLVIASRSSEQLDEIADYLLTNRLVISVDFHNDIGRKEFENGKIESYKIHFITGKTKSLLFKEIDLRLRNLYKDNIPEIFSHPIINMDWELADKLKSYIEKI
jgi:uncharacterized protein involved in tolerance to divalent cations